MKPEWIKLNIKDRQKAVDLEEWVMDEPEEAAALIISLQNLAASISRDLDDQKWFNAKTKESRLASEEDDR